MAELVDSDKELRDFRNLGVLVLASHLVHGVDDKVSEDIVGKYFSKIGLGHRFV